MARVLIVYHSRGGNTRSMAEKVAEGVRSAGGEAVLAPAADTKAGQLAGYDGIIIGSPTYYGTMAAEVKRLLDESVALQGQLAGKAGGAFASAANIGGGSETTVLDIVHALLVHGMVVQGSESGGHYGPVAVGGPDGRAAEECRQLGRRVVRLAGRGG